MELTSENPLTFRAIIESYDTNGIENEIRNLCYELNSDSLLSDTVPSTEDFKSFVSAIWETIKKFFRTIIDILKKIWDNLGKFIDNLIAKAKALFKRVFYSLPYGYNKNNITATIPFNKEFKEKAEAFVRELKKDLEHIRVDGYVSDNRLENVPLVYKELHNAFNDIISNNDKFNSYIEYSRDNKDCFGYIKNNYNISTMMKDPDLYRYIIADTQKYGEDTNVYEIANRLTPEIFDSNAIMKDVEKVHDNTLNIFKDKINLVSGFINQIEKLAQDDLAFLCDVHDRRIKQVAESRNRIQESLFNKDLCRDGIYAILTYLRRTINILANAAREYTLSFNMIIGSFIRYLKDMGIRNTSQEVYIENKAVTNLLFSHIKPIVIYDSVGIYSGKDIYKELCYILGVKYTNTVINGTNAACIYLENTVQPIILLSDFIINQFPIDGDVFKYICYHEIGHFMNGDVIKSTNMYLLRYLCNISNPKILEFQNKITSGRIITTRTLEQEIKADIYIVERRIFTPQRLYDAMIQSYKKTAMYYNKPMDKYIDKLVDAKIRLNYVKEWADTGKIPDIPITDRDKLLKEYMNY